MQHTNFPAGPPALSSSTIAQYQFYRKFIADPLAMVSGWFADYGDMAYLRTGETGHQYFLSNPDAIREVLVKQTDVFIKGEDYTDEKTGLARFMGHGLVTSNGDFWKRQRLMVAPAFHTQRIAAYAQTMVDYGLRCMSGWQDDGVLDIDHEMMKLTLMVVGRTLFDTDASATIESVARVVDVLQKASNTPSLLPPWVPTLLRIRSRFATRELDKIVYEFIEARRQSGEDRGDLLSMLLLSEDADGNRMTDKQARDEAVTLFLAGHETTANTLNWTWWLLSQYPEVEAKLHDEIDTVLAGHPPTLDDLRRLPYTDAVIKESMRLMPPVWSIGRTTIRDTEVLGYSFPKGTGVTVVIYGAHRHPDIWEKPNTFIPERWLSERINDVPKHAYLPFSTGPRVCIGSGFATMEANLLLATIARQYRFSLAPNAKVVPQPFVTMFPKYGLPMIAHKR